MVQYAHKKVNFVGEFPVRVLYKHLSITNVKNSYNGKALVMVSHNSKKRHAKKLAKKHSLTMESFTTVWVNNRAQVQY